MTKWLVLVMVLSTQAFAVDCAAPEGTTPLGIGSRSAEARLSFLSKLLDEEGQAARRWTLAWGGIYGAFTIAQLAVMPAFTREEQPDWYWGALSTAVGVAFSVVGPLEVLDGGAAFARRASAASPEQTCQLIAEGERMLREGADQEEFSHKWYMHGANMLFNIGIGLILALGYGHWTSGIVNGAVGIAIGEATIFTSPNKLMSGWEHYRAGGSDSPVSFHIVPTAGPGVGVLLTF
jgi:hypothetical protein